MSRHTLYVALVVLTAGCGMGTEADLNAGATGEEQDALYRSQLAQTADLDRQTLGRADLCRDEIIRPQLVATVREMVQLRTREVITDIGEVVQSSYLNTNGDNEEVRRGIAEFDVQGDFQSAQLRFKESRTVWPYPVPSDTHRISVYSADFKATIDDFADPAQGVVRFETDVNSLPRDLVTTDVTRAVQTRQPAVGFRFELENVPGSGTQFDNLELVVRRCQHTVREL